MCIIAAKPSGIDLPNKETLENCFTSNRDGIGFSYNLPGAIPTISKGFFSVKKLMKALEQQCITKEHNLIIHFRFGTHGKKDSGNCHPFPLSPSFKDMRLLDCTCSCAIAHNGVFGNMPKSVDHSDTMKFIGGILASPEIINNLHSSPVKELIRGYCGMSSKLAFLTTEGLTTIGDWELDKGIYYSNRQFTSYCNRSTYKEPDKDSEYCYEHLKWDYCWRYNKRNNLDWCYAHKAYDHCRWCSDHQERDTCEYDKKVKEGKIIIPTEVTQDTILDLRTPCEWCRSVDDVKYDTAQESYLCKECTKTLSDYMPYSGHDTIRGRYDD